MTPFEHLNLLLRLDRALQLRRMIEAKVRRGMRVLDAGCGLGLLSQWAVQAGASYVLAVDLDDLALARQLAKENNTADSIEFHVGDLRELPSTRPDVLRSFDVIIAMVYLNDPRRDQVQSGLVSELRDAYLAPHGSLVPDAVSYSAAPLHWPQQDWPSRQCELTASIDSIERRYGLGFRALCDELRSMPQKSSFPYRDAGGIVHRPGSRLLGDLKVQFTVDYNLGSTEFPTSIQLDASDPGIFNVVLWTQDLFCGDALVFRNESISWLAEPTFVEPEQSVTLGLDSSWRKENVFRQHK